MGQISYGTITITDTNDIEEIYMVYAGSSSDTTPPDTSNFNLWKTDISQITGDYNYLWQRAVVKKSGIAITSSNFQEYYGDPVCITGPEGADGRGVSSIVTSYCNYGEGTPAASYSGWGSTIPVYDEAKPNYWVKTVITYTSGSPATNTTIVKDNGITSANATAVAADEKASQAQIDAGNALSIANGASSLATGINQHFWWLESDTTTSGGTLAAGSYITDVLQNTFKQTPGTYGNLLLRSDGVYLNLGLQTLASFKSNALTFYTNAGGEIGAFGANGLDMSGSLNVRGGGYIGQDSINYWEFGDNRSYKDTDSAYLMGKGNASLQLGESGHWRLDRDRIHSGWYQLTDATRGLLHFDTGLDNNSEYYWDYGLHYPNKAGNGNNKFIYVRRSTTTTTNTSLATLKGRIDNDTWWFYKFYVDGNGSIHSPSYYIINNDGTEQTLSGSGLVASSLSCGTVGSLTQPVYFNNGVPAITTFQLNAAGAKGVDTSIAAASTSTNLPTSQAVASFVEGKGYLTSYTETDPTVPNWAKASSKPSYSLNEIGSAQDIQAIEALTGTSGILRKTAANTWSLDTNSYLTSYTETDPVFIGSAAYGITNNDITNWNSKTSNTGTVTSVRVQASSPLQSSSNTAQSTSLNTTISFINQNANKILAGPASGSAAAPTFRSLVVADIPDLSSTYYLANNPDGYTTNTGTVTSVKVQGSNGLTGSGTVTTSGTITISHEDTSSQSSSLNTGRTYIQSITLDSYGHVTELSTASETVTNTHYEAYLYDTTSTGTSRVTTDTIDPYLTLVENGSARSRIRLKAGTNITSITANNGVITFAAKDTTYTAASSVTAVGTTAVTGTSTNYARQDHIHNIALATGDSNGQVKIAGTNVSVKGLGSWAYKSSGSASDVGLGNAFTDVSATPGSGGQTTFTFTKAGGGTKELEVVVTASTATSATNLIGTDGNPISTTGVVTFSSGLPVDTGFTIGKSVPSDAKFTDTTYSFADTYNASTNKGATVATVTNAINALDGGTIGTPGTGKTITAISQTNGNISVTFGNISITASQVSDLSTAVSGMTAEPASHSHGNITNSGDITATAPTITSGDQIIINDNSASKITNGPTFDGSTTTKALTPKGTWETFLQSHQTYTSFTGNPAANVTPSFGGTVTISQIKQSTTGQVSGTDRTITIPATIATYNAIGLIQPWYSTTGAAVLANNGSASSNTSTPTINTRTSTSGKYYAVEIDKNGRLFVNVPWTDTTYTIPTVTQSAKTNISIADHNTTTIYGVSSNTTSVTGVSGSTTVRGVKTDSTTTASKASGSNGSASSWTFETKTVTKNPSFTYNSSDTSLTISFGTETIYSKSGGSNGTAPTWSFSDVTVPIRADSNTTVPTAASNATTVPIKNTNTTTVVTSGSHSITDNGHSHTI